MADDPEVGPRAIETIKEAKGRGNAGYKVGEKIELSGRNTGGLCGFFCRTIVAVFVLLLNGCAGTTLIKNLALPPVSIIEGNIAHLDKDGFILLDNSGSIYVKAKLPDNKKLNLSVDEKVRIYGNLQGGQEKIFDGYVIKKSNGEQIVISNPAPHFGFVIQSSFH
jgi:hypothetical protein